MADHRPDPIGIFAGCLAVTWSVLVFVAAFVALGSAAPELTVAAVILAAGLLLASSQYAVRRDRRRETRNRDRDRTARG